VQRRLIDDEPSDHGVAAFVAGDLEALEPGGPVAVEHALDADLVLGWYLVCWRWVHPVTGVPMASQGAWANGMGMVGLLSAHPGRGVIVLVEEAELVGQCPVPDGGIGVEVEVRPWVDP
jgi:hypothetical protein